MTCDAHWWMSEDRGLWQDGPLPRLASTQATTLLKYRSSNKGTESSSSNATHEFDTIHVDLVNLGYGFLGLENHSTNSMRLYNLKLFTTR